jgi:hypothetical protein
MVTRRISGYFGGQKYGSDVTIAFYSEIFFPSFLPDSNALISIYLMQKYRTFKPCFALFIHTLKIWIQFINTERILTFCRPPKASYPWGFHVTPDLWAPLQ